MKLKTFTVEETQQLIDDLNKYWGLCQLITQEAKAKIAEGHAAQLRDFVWSWKRPFTRPIKDIEDMVYKITGGQFRTTHYDFIIGKGFTEHLSSWMGNSDPHYNFVQPHYNELIVSASLVGSWKRTDIAKFHELVEQYAEHPLVPDANDIEIIKTVRSRIVLLTEYLDTYKNAI